MAKTTNPTTASREIRDVEHRFAEAQALFSSIGEGAIVTDIEGNISRINKSALDLLGFSEEELIGKWFPEVIVADGIDGVRLEKEERPIYEVFLTGQVVFRKMYYRRKDKSRVAVALTVSPVLLDNKPIGAIEVFRDITEELKLERAKDEFIALASHQLRTPATAVKQYSAMLLDGYAGEVSDAQRNMIQKVYQSNERQINTINDLLRIAQIDAGRLHLDLSSVDLSELLVDIVNEHTHKFESRSQRITLLIPPRSVIATVDKGRFRMAVENLIDNACKYTPEGKSVQIKLGHQKGRIAIEVRDEGVGIPRKEQARIFEKFSRVDNPLSIAVGGTGLGLYWVQKIIDLHGAEIQIRSKVGEGTVFTIYLAE